MTIELDELQPNVLDKYTQYSYYFRLFMMDEPSALAKSVPGPDQIPEQNIIAETGGASKNGCSIEDVTITSYGGMDKESGMGISSSFDMKIMQSLGATLLNDISDTAKQLGIKNFIKIPFFLELTFRVRDADNQDPLGWRPLSGYRWVWPIAFEDTKMDITSSGSTYNIKSVFFDTIGIYKERADLRQNIEISAENVGEFFKQLGEVMSSPEEDVEKNVYMKRDTYKFDVNPEIAAMKLEQTDKTDVDTFNLRSGSFTETDGDGKEKLQYAATTGTSIDNIVFDILTGTKFFQTEIAANNSAEDSNKPTATTNIDKKFKKLFRVVQTVELGEFNQELKDYNKNFIYEIEFYESSTHLSSPSDADKIRLSLGEYIERGVLKKAYNYIFTGLNNSVIDFDLNFKFHWYAAFPVQASEYLRNIRNDLGAKDVNDREQLPSQPLTNGGTINEENEFQIPGQYSNSLVTSNTNSLETVGRNLISVLFEQAVSATSGDLINVDIEIKGDPFWLEPDPLPNAGITPNYYKRATRVPTDTNNNSTGRQTYCIFTAYLPEEVNPDTGQMRTPDKRNIINGVYSVRKVTHKFSKGKFTQTLTAVRDPHINLNNFL